MHNIMVTGGSEGQPRSYAIGDLKKKRPSNIAGENGLKNGQWWPFRICMIRDGAHGASQAGIDGGEKDVAYAIVISGGQSKLSSTRPH